MTKDMWDNIMRLYPNSDGNTTPVGGDASGAKKLWEFDNQFKSSAVAFTAGLSVATTLLFAAF